MYSPMIKTVGENRSSVTWSCWYFPGLQISHYLLLGPRMTDNDIYRAGLSLPESIIWFCLPIFQDPFFQDSCNFPGHSRTLLNSRTIPGHSRTFQYKGDFPGHSRTRFDPVHELKVQPTCRSLIVRAALTYIFKPFVCGYVVRLPCS